MFITKLDISWIDSPFMYHHILIKSQKQIDKLIKAGVKLVTIDTAKGKDISIAQDSKEEDQCLKALMIIVSIHKTQKSILTLVIL